MATKSLQNSSSCIYLLNLVLLISGKLCASDNLLKDVCRQTQDEAFCMNVLGSDPRTRDARLFQLGQITIDLGAYSATGTKVKIHSLFLSEKDPELKIRLSVCDENYDDAIDSLREAVDDLEHGEYTDLKLEGGSVYGDAYDCEDAFKKPPAYTSPLTDENYRLQRFGEIIIIIANMFRFKDRFF
ncbi:hypothetical protein DH2020_048277 [Rehmannia glutinosa]|uniref:Pectinesterase inhibitor domain-containing protein n=1 Tax=Rehmannia glutinosa TaxID=99300 RepID=A0ABR0U6E8_REHGL